MSKWSVCVLMIKLEPSQVFLKQEAKNKYDALQLAGLKMLETGLVSNDYLPGIHARESLASTFLDHGIAIPHGLPESRDAIHKTGVVVIQFPEGVKWEHNQQVYLAFGIAAHCNEHLKILSGLTRVLDNRPLCKLLSKTTERQVILDALEGKLLPGCEPEKEYLFLRRNAQGWAKAPKSDSQFSMEFTLNNENGFHSRCCTAFISAIESIDAKIDVRNVSKSSLYVNGRSLVKLLSLEVTTGETVEVRVSGDSSNSAKSRLESLFKNGMNDI